MANAAFFSVIAGAAFTVIGILTLPFFLRAMIAVPASESSKSLAMLERVYDHLTAAAIDRVVHHAVVLEFLGPSARAEVAEERARAAQNKRNSAPPADA